MRRQSWILKVQFEEVCFSWAVLMKEDEASRPRMWPSVREAAIWAVKGPSPQPMSRILSVGSGDR